MRYLAVLLSALWLIAPGMPSAEGAAPAAGMSLVYAITEAAAGPRTTTVYLHAADSGERRTLYDDASDENRILLRIAASDVVGAARTAPPGDVYLIMGEASMGDLSMGADALCRLRVAEAGEEQAPAEPILVIPLCFSDASPYGLWNRAPIFAVSPGAKRFALYALRAGDVRFAGPAIRVLAADGTEEWRIMLDDPALYVADLAWSPDGRFLAYAVMPQGDEHTLDDALLSKAGLYLADLDVRTGPQSGPGDRRRTCQRLLESAVCRSGALCSLGREDRGVLPTQSSLGRRLLQRREVAGRSGREWRQPAGLALSFD